MKFKITEQTANIGWKETDYGKSKTRIVDYDNLEKLLEGEGFYDEDWDEDLDEDENLNQYHRMLEAIEEDGGFMCDDYETTRYWAQPEPCDSYLTYGVYYKFEEISDEEVAKIEKEKEKKLSKNTNKWNDLFSSINSLEDLKKELLKYKFPIKVTE